SIETSFLSRVDSRGDEKGGAGGLCAAVLPPCRSISDLSLGGAREVRRSGHTQGVSQPSDRRRGWLAESSRSSAKVLPRPRGFCFERTPIGKAAGNKKLDRRVPISVPRRVDRRRSRGALRV